MLTGIWSWLLHQTMRGLGAFLSWVTSVRKNVAEIAKLKAETEKARAERRVAEGQLVDRAVDKDLTELANQFQAMYEKHCAEAGISIGRFSSQVVQDALEVLPERAQTLIAFMRKEGRIEPVGRDRYEFSRDKTWRNK